MASVTRVEISPAQKTYYDELFRLADTDSDGVIGVKDAGFFRKSGLADAVLGEVWQLADPRKDGFLDRDGFTVALSLISVAQQGKRLALESLRPAPPPPKLAEVPPMKVEGLTSPAQFQWVVSPQEKMQYQSIFRSADDDNDGFITGNQARTLFGNSGLPMQILGHIWAMADMTQDQRLDLNEFCVAMFLINAKKKGLELPPAIPESLLVSIRTDVPPASINSPLTASFGVASTLQNEWIIPPAEKVKFEDLFKKNDTDHDGFITGEQAKALFSRSGLPNTELGKIWLLSDINQDQRLDRQEFYIAMALINRRLSGREIPLALPEALTVSARGDAGSAPTTPAVGGSVTRKGNYAVNMDDIEPLSNGPTPLASPALAHSLGMDDSTPAASPSISVAPRFAGSGAPTGSAQGFAPSPHMPAYPQSVMSPPIMSSGLQASGSFSSVPGSITPSAALELERLRQAEAQAERQKTESTKRLNDETAASNEVLQQLVEERARVDAIVAEIREIEAQITNQKNRGAQVKEQLGGTRLELKTLKGQQEQLELILKEKNEQCTEQQELLTMLTTELTEKTSEVNKLQREVESTKATLDNLKTATTEVKTQLVGVKKQISENKAELQKLTEESKLIRQESRRSTEMNNTSPASAVRPGSPAIFQQPSTSPPAPRPTAASATDPTKNPSSLSKTTPFTSPTFSSPFPNTDFSFNTSDTFAFDNGKEDPFAQTSKDGFGFGSVTQDSFGTTSEATSSPVFAKTSGDSFFATESFGETTDPFASSAFASARDAFGAENGFGFGSESFGSPNPIPRTPANSIMQGQLPPTPANSIIQGQLPPTPANSVIQGQLPPTPANSVIQGQLPPTPANSVIQGQLPPTPANSVIQGQLPPTPANSVIQGQIPVTPANSVIAPPTPANSVIAAKDPNNNNIPTTFAEDAFSNSPFFATTSFDSESFGTVIESPFSAFGGGGDAFGSSDAFGGSSVTNDAFGGSSVTNDAFGSSGDAFGSDTSDSFGGDTNDAFRSAPGAGTDAFGGKNSFGAAPADSGFGTSDAFGGSAFTNTFDFTTEKNDNFFQ